MKHFIKIVVFIFMCSVAFSLNKSPNAGPFYLAIGILGTAYLIYRIKSDKEK